MNRIKRYFEKSQPAVSADAYLAPGFGSLGFGLSGGNPFAQLENILNAFYGQSREPSYGDQITQIDGAIQIEMELPGFSTDQVVVETHKGILSIRAEVEAKQESGYQRQSVRRSYRLPEGTDTETITAELKNGILTIVVPYKEGGETRKIPIN